MRASRQTGSSDIRWCDVTPGLSSRSPHDVICNHTVDVHHYSYLGTLSQLVRYTERQISPRWHKEDKPRKVCP